MEGQGGLVILIPSISFGSTIGRVWPKLKRDFRFINSKNHLFQADRKVLLLVEEIALEDRSVASLSTEEEPFSSQI